MAEIDPEVVNAGGGGGTPPSQPVAEIDPEAVYAVQAACDHHVLEAQRVRRFVDFIERWQEVGREKALRSAGHLMYASHKSTTGHAALGGPAADLLVDLVKRHEAAGVYGARITGRGSGGTVVVLLEGSDRAQEAIASIREAYREQSGREAGLIAGTSPGTMVSPSRSVRAAPERAGAWNRVKAREGA